MIGTQDRMALLQEPVRYGQRIERFALDALAPSGWREIAQATTIGYKRLLRFPPISAQKVRIRILESRYCPMLARFGLFRQAETAG